MCCVFCLALGTDFQVQVPDADHISLCCHDSYIFHCQSGECPEMALSRISLMCCVGFEDKTCVLDLKKFHRAISFPIGVNKT